MGTNTESVEAGDSKMNYLLIVAITTLSSGGVSTVVPYPYSSEVQCMKAGEQWKKDIRSHGHKSYTCISIETTKQ